MNTQNAVKSAEKAAWEPFVPTQETPWDLKKVAHLHRRAGFWASWSELQRDLREGVDAAVNRFLDPGEEPEEMREVLHGLREGVIHALDKSERLAAYWLHRMLFYPDPLREKMTLFWHSHFATSNEKVANEALMLEQNELLRKHALGDFAKMVGGILADPAMLIWLDAANSPKEMPNENLGRELLELFTLGVGNYTEQDIREAARALTGWTQNRNSYGSNRFRFDITKFDNGQKRFLGSVGPWGRHDIVRLTLDHPACARFICRKLYRQFIGEHHQPSAELIEPLAQELRSHDYSIRHVVGIILRSNQFFAESNRRQRIASPVELSVGLLRALEIPRRNIRLTALADACQSQGQRLFYPPNVAGWAGGRHWITSTNMVERSNWLSDVIWGSPEFDQPPFDPKGWQERNGVNSHDLCSAFIDLILQGDLSLDAREIAMSIAAPGDPDSLRKMIQLLGHCPEYQLL